MKPGLKGLLAGLVPAMFVVLCRLSPEVADFYSLKMYPVISLVLSWMTSHVPFSVNDILIVFFILLALFYLFRRRFIKFVSLLVWVFVWLYLGWGVNYYRSGISARAGLARSGYDEAVFADFLKDYTGELNEAFDKKTTLDTNAVREEIMAYYSALPSEYGLCKPREWQRPKPMLLNRIQSAVGVTGYEGPFGAEFHINRDVLPDAFPFTYAHEMSHLMGVSSEAEANWWAFDSCRKSGSGAARYSAYYSILGYVWSNARSLLPPEAFSQWSATVNPRIIEDLEKEQDYWQDKEFSLLSKAQSMVYNLFLKGNRISSGTRNYSEIVGIIIAFDYD